jgi:rhodanese-related sulfurtransferase
MNQLKISTILTIIVLFCLSSIPISAGEQLKKHDPSLAISVDSAIRQHRKNSIFLVDVRNRKAFETLKIPGSLNIPLYAVKTRPFLKSQPIVLVNAGFAGSLLEQECRQLNQKGFKASFLTGGLNAWSHRGGPLEGDLFAVQTLAAVSPRIYHQEKDFKNTIVIEVSGVRGSSSKQLIPAAIHLPQVGASANQPMHNLSLSDLRASVRENRKNPTSAILITNQDGKGYEHLEKTIAKADLGPVFYLTGGLNGYSRFLDHLALSRKPQAKRVKTINECSPCGPKEKE